MQATKLTFRLVYDLDKGLHNAILVGTTVNDITKFTCDDIIERNVAGDSKPQLEVPEDNVTMNETRFQTDIRIAIVELNVEEKRNREFCEKNDRGELKRDG